jgi:uncharacterized protein YdeI (YjbR/CyaY-like superfamily)
LATKPLKTLEIAARRHWRRWLDKHHDCEAEIWLVFYKQHTGRNGIEYRDALEEALCFGWVDSLVKRLDDDRFARKFTPRKADSRWSTVNRKLYADLLARGLVAPPGLKRPPTDKCGDTPRPGLKVLPSYIEKALRANARAWAFFEELAPSYRRQCIAWIDSAKREETKEKRLGEVLQLMAAGKKLGLK